MAVFYSIFIEMNDGSREEEASFGSDALQPFASRKQAEEFAQIVRTNRDVRTATVIASFTVPA